MGVVIFSQEKREIFYFKRVEKIADSKEDFEKANLTGHPFIFHNRWAAHGFLAK